MHTRARTRTRTRTRTHGHADARALERTAGGPSSGSCRDSWGRWATAPNDPPSANAAVGAVAAVAAVANYESVARRSWRALAPAECHQLSGLGRSVACSTAPRDSSSFPGVTRASCTAPLAELAASVRAETAEPTAPPGITTAPTPRPRLPMCRLALDSPATPPQLHRNRREPSRPPASRLLRGDSRCGPLRAPRQHLNRSRTYLPHLLSLSAS
jgi:hypothetical protein